MEDNLNIVFLVVGIVVGFVIGYLKHKSSVSLDMRNLVYYKSHFLQKTGASLGYGSYQLRSFDGGLNWYAVDVDLSSGAVTIKGPAEDVFPGLLAHLDGLDRLTKYVAKNGPITLSVDRSATGMAILRGAGFTVETR